MELKFIGTGSGKTSLNRYHSSIIISLNKFKLLVDAGDGIARALLNAGEKFTEIDAIIISHFHPDHYSGIASLIVQMKIMKRSKPLNIFTHAKLSNYLKSFLESCNIFTENLDFQLKITDFEFVEKFHLGKFINCIAKQNSHITNKNNSNTNAQFISSSFLFEINDIKIFFTADLGSKDDLYLFNGFNVDLMIVETAHIELSDIEKAANQLDVKRIFLTHINDEDENKINNWSLEKNKYAKKYFIAEDRLVINPVDF